MTYGNGDQVSYTYDRFGNIATISYDGTVAVQNFTDASGNVTRTRDLLTNLEHTVTYDTIGRLVSTDVFDLSVTGNADKWLRSIEYDFDLNNNVTMFAFADKDGSNVTTYTYMEDNLLDTVTLNNGKVLDYSYDALGRLISKSLNATTPLSYAYTYEASDRGAGYTTTKLETETIGNTKYRYTYDVYGNIKRIYSVATDNTETLLHLYNYDNNNQLVADMDTVQGTITDYAYDSNGNILQKKVSQWDGNIYCTVLQKVLVLNVRSINCYLGELSMKKFIVLLWVLMMLITSFCGCTKNSPATNVGDSTVPYYNFETDCQFNMTNPPFEHYAAKGTEGYFLLNDGYLYFADISMSSATILCNKPNCLHNEVYLNTDCNAYVGVVGSITYNEGYVYYIGSNAEADDGSSLMRVATDGSGTREDVYSKKYNTDKWAVHRGCFYNAYREYRLEDKLENINRSRLVVEKVPLSGKGEAEILFDSVDFLQDSSFTYIVVFDNYLYYSYQYYTDNDELSEKLVCYDLENYTEKEITIPEGDTNLYEFGINYIYPLGDKLIFKVGYEIYQCDLNAENIEKILTLEDEYHNIFADGTYLYEDNFANFMHSDLLSIEQAPSRVLKVYDSNFNLVDTLNVGDYEMSFRPVDEMCFLSIDNNGVMSYFDKSEIGKVKGGNWENRTFKTLS